MGHGLGLLETLGKGCVAGVQGGGRGAGVLEEVPMIRPAVEVTLERKEGRKERMGHWLTRQSTGAQGPRLGFVNSLFH